MLFEVGETFPRHPFEDPYFRINKLIQNYGSELRGGETLPPSPPSVTGWDMDL